MVHVLEHADEKYVPECANNTVECAMQVMKRVRSRIHCLMCSFWRDPKATGCMFYVHRCKDQRKGPGTTFQICCVGEILACMTRQSL